MDEAAFARAQIREMGGAGEFLMERAEVYPNGIAFDSRGNIYIAGQTQSAARADAARGFPAKIRDFLSAGEAAAGRQPGGRAWQPPRLAAPPSTRSDQRGSE